MMKVLPLFPENHPDSKTPNMNPKLFPPPDSNLAMISIKKHKNVPNQAQLEQNLTSNIHQNPKKSTTIRTHILPIS